MIFEGKILEQISDDEIISIINEHLSERQHVEYKVTINHRDDNDRFETLCDICSFANSGGGYLIVGIRDDGNGRAQKFETVHDPERIVRSIRSLCIDHIVERIDGLEMEVREISGDNIILIRIPSSGSIPHMVTFKNNTHFVSRYQDGKHIMSINEIRSAFINDIVGRKLSLIEDGIRNLAQGQQFETRNQTIRMLENGEISLINVNDGSIISEATLKAFREEIGEQPFFRISITPLTTKRNLINVDDQIVRQLIEHPGQRDSGWNMDMFYSSLGRYSEGVYKGSTDDRILRLSQNGHMEFAAKLDEVFCWKQTVEEFKLRPRLYSIPVVEFPCSFLRLYKRLIELLNLDMSFLVSMQFLNLQRYGLNPYSPESVGYLMRGTSSPYGKRDLIVPPIEVQVKFRPDSVTYELIKYVYASFGYTEEKIPYYDRTQELFVVED